MENQTNKARKGLLICLCAIVTAVGLAVVTDTSKELNKQVTYFTRVKPGAVHYGTHSSVSMPAVSSRLHSSVPIVSGGAVRGYAYYGHSSASSTASGTGYKLYTTSSATLHSYGGGGGCGGIGASHGSSSSKGIQYGGSSVSMPTLALGTPAYGAQSSISQNGNMRRIPSSPGTWEGETAVDGEGEWTWDGEGWSLTIPEGSTKIVDGKTYVFRSGEWVLIDDQQDPGLPVGDTPWIWMLLLAALYVLYTTKKKAALAGRFFFEKILNDVLRRGVRKNSQRRAVRLLLDLSCNVLTEFNGALNQSLLFSGSSLFLLCRSSYFYLLSLFAATFVLAFSLFFSASYCTKSNSCDKE